jgi:Zn-dependent oligopeptidase
MHCIAVRLLRNNHFEFRVTALKVARAGPQAKQHKLSIRMASSWTPPNVDLQWHLGPAEIKERTQAMIIEADTILDAIAACSGAACTWDNVISPLAAMERDAEARTVSLTFVKNVSVQKDVRTAAAAAQAELSAWEVKAGMREDVFRAVKQFAASANMTSMDAEGRRFVERTLRDYRRRGLDLAALERAQIEAIKTRLSDIAVAFQQALVRGLEQSTRILVECASVFRPSYFPPPRLKTRPSLRFPGRSWPACQTTLCRGWVRGGGKEGALREVM